MTGLSDPDEVVEVRRDDVVVRKTFEAEQFPVPAIRFRISSERDDPASVRIAEAIPEEFPMDGVGFHPDYDSESWTAFQDHHVEYTTRVDAGEEVETVYGIRIDDPSEAEKFLTEPEIACVSSPDDHEDETDGIALEDTMIADIASGDRSQVVKDMISGESDVLPGLEDDEPAGADDGAGSGSEIELDLDIGDDDVVEAEPMPSPDADEPSAEDESDAADDVEADADAEVADAAETDDADDGAEVADAAETGDSDDAAETVDADDAAETGDVDDAVDATETGDGDDADVDEPAAAATPSPAGIEGSIAEALAAELRAGEVSERDQRALREALEIEPSGADRARIEHLQSRVEEVAAYADALELFLDEEGTGQELVDDFRADVADLRDSVESLDARVDDQAEDVSDVESSVDGIESDLEDVEASVESLGGDLSEVRDDLTSLGDDVESTTGDVSDLESSIDDVAADIADVQEQLDDVADTVEGIQQWREQLGEMFTRE